MAFHVLIITQMPGSYFLLNYNAGVNKFLTSEVRIISQSLFVVIRLAQRAQGDHAITSV